MQVGCVSTKITRLHFHIPYNLALPILGPSNLHAWEDTGSGRSRREDRKGVWKADIILYCCSDFGVADRGAWAAEDGQGPGMRGVGKGSGRKR